MAGDKRSAMEIMNSHPDNGMLAPDEVSSLNEQFSNGDTVSVLRWAWERFGDRAAIGTSFQGAGLVMMHLAHAHGLPFPIFTLDTGLLFPETVELKNSLEAFFGRKIEVVAPDQTVSEQQQTYGPELWRRDPDLCCFLRKVQPLQRKLAQLDCWITGLRREQGPSRANVQIVEVYLADSDTGREIVKLNPMAGWKREEVWDYIRRNRIPYNPLHDRGYRSIGCQPCTNPAGGPDERAGRWTGFNKTECGIHTFMPKKQ